MTPEPGSIITNPNPVISAKITDPNLDPDTIKMVFDGVDVSTEAPFVDDYINYPASNLEDKQEHFVYLEAKDKSGNLAQ